MYKYGQQTVCKTQTDINRIGGTIVKNTDGTVDVFFRGISDVQINNKACCEILGFNFNIDKQRCYWSNVPAKQPCDDCTTKVVYNPKDSDGVIFNVRESETCSLELSLDYILNFDCDLFSKVCSNSETEILIKEYTTTISSLKIQISTKKTECESLTKRIEDLTTIFNGLCYVIKGTKTTTTTNTGSGVYVPGSIYDDWTKPTRFNTDGTTTTTTGGGTTTTTTGGGTTTTTTGGGTTTTGGGTTTTGGGTTVIYNEFTKTWEDTTFTPFDVTGERTPVRPYYIGKDATEATTTNTINTNTGGIGTNVYDTTIYKADLVPAYYDADGALTNSDGVVYTGIRNASSDFTNNILPVTPKYNNLSFRNETIGTAPITTSSVRQSNTPPPPFAWQWKSAYIKETTRTNTTTSGPVSYCLTEKGLALWSAILGANKYDMYTNSFGCDETTYTQTNFNDLIAKVNVEVNNNTSLKVTDFITETTQGPCDKKIANDNLSQGRVSAQNCSNQLEELNKQVANTTALLNETRAANTSSSNTPISNLENLQVHLNLEVETTPNKYESVYEEPIFNIGQGNLLNYILNQSPNTGILISGTTAGGIFTPPFAFDLEDYATTYRAEPSANTCETGRAKFMKDLYLQQYKGVFPDPTTPDEELVLNKKMNAWYNSSWLYYKKTLDETITAKILNKKIKISLRIENCCLDLCILTDNLNLTKTCESLDNQEIIISESPKFEIERVMDNRKSWVSYTENTDREHDLQFRETQYDIDDYRLSINTKEIDLKIDGANAIEEDVLCIIDCLISGDTGSTVTGTCCSDKCDYGYVSTIDNVEKSFNNGKYNGNYREHPAYHIGYSIQTPLFKSLDTYTPSVEGWGYEYHQNSINQGIWKPIYPKVNVHVWWDDKLIEEVTGDSSCDWEDYASTNRAWRDAALKAKNQLLLATSPHDWAQFEVPNFQIEKYYLNRPCSTSEFRVGEVGPGGIVAYVDGTGQHGLVVLEAAGGYYGNPKKYWHSTDSGLVSATGDTLYSGISNTSLIVAAYGSEANVAKYCSDFTTTGNDGTIYSDYYLPSKYELNLIAQNWREIGIRLPDITTYAWSSTENNVSTAWAQNIYDGTQAIYNKSTVLSYVIVRKF